MDVLALFGWRTCRETPFKNSFSSASLPTRRSRAAMRASYSAAVSLSSPPASNLATQILIRLRPIPWRLARACSDSPPRNSWTTWRLNSIECVRCLAMGFLLESPVQLADSHLPHLSTPRGALHRHGRFWPPITPTNELSIERCNTNCALPLADAAMQQEGDDSQPVGSRCHSGIAMKNHCAYCHGKFGLVRY